jgi:NADH-quinone oxidoreductase chain G
MIKIKINNFEFLVKSDISVLEACKFVGIDIPRFCYHEMLSVSGNCRMCLVEVEKSPKPVASCALPVTNNMQIYVDSPLVKKARENVLEALLLNHPLDCPICDQGGECDLQDQTKVFGGDFSRFFFNKRGVEDKECGPLIKTIMTRCIHCTRCVRFGSEIAGIDFLGTLNRGGSTEIGGYISGIFNSEISGNVIDLCPVGALTSKPYAFKVRPWEIRSNESVDLTDSTGSNIYVNFKESEIIRILPKNNSEINESIISDKARFSYDSIKTQRLQQIFTKFNNKFVASNWKDIFKQIDTLLYNNKNVLILINDELDTESLNLLRALNNTFKNSIKIRSVSALNNNQDNIFLNTNTDKIQDIKTVSKYCFLLSTNIRLESAILNTKIRTKYMDQNFNIFALGQKFDSSFPLEFVNLNINKILEIFEGKNITLSKAFISFKNPLIFIGQGFEKRFYNLDTLINLLKRIMPTSKILNIKSSCNSSGHDLFTVKSFNKNDLLKSDALIALNLDDNFILRKYLFEYKKLLFWFNTHRSTLATKATHIIPVTTSFEDEGVYVNLEGRPQKILKTLAGIKDTRAIKSVLKAINIKNNPEKSYKFLNYISELVKTSKHFSHLRNILLTNSTVNKHILKKSLTSNYPLKASVENFYVTNKFTKNSLTMIQCSQKIFKDSTNF